VAAQNADNEADVHDWARNGHLYQMQVQAAMDDWVANGYKNEVDKINAFLDQVTQRDLTLWKRSLQQRYDNIITDPTSTRQFRWTSLIPAAFAETTDGWTKFEFSESMVDTYAHKEGNSWGAEGGASFGLFKNQAFAMWVSRGYKNGIETSLATVEQISGRNPQLVWQQWKQSFSQAIKTDLRGNAFYDTYLWPANFLDADSPAQWTELRMDAGEIQALSSMAADSTQQLATTLTTEPAQAQALDVDVSNLSLELARVEVMRPWLEPLVFENRAWRWPDDREPLSDGEEPPNGSLPAYVTAIVFARNLEIELEESSEQIVGQFHAVP
jgi:hypothetical protein